MFHKGRVGSGLYVECNVVQEEREGEQGGGVQYGAPFLCTPLENCALQRYNILCDTLVSRRLTTRGGGAHSILTGSTIDPRTLHPGRSARGARQPKRSQTGAFRISVAWRDMMRSHREGHA